VSWRQGSNNLDNPINPEYEQEARLVEQARAGSERAFSALLARYQQPVFRLIYYLVGNEHDARELTRIALKHSLRRMPRVPSGYSIRPWLLRVASLVALEAVRERHETPEELIATLELPPRSSGPTIIESDPTLADTMLLSIQELSEEPATVIADAWDRLPVDIERELIRRIMASLPENDAELLALGVVGQVPTRDLAAIAGTSQRSIRRRIARALILFQGHYQTVRTAALPAPPETKELPAASISGITAINAITRRSIAEATDMVRRGWNGLRGLGTAEAQERLESLRDEELTNSSPTTEEDASVSDPNATMSVSIIFPNEYSEYAHPTQDESYEYVIEVAPSSMEYSSFDISTAEQETVISEVFILVDEPITYSEEFSVASPEDTLLLSPDGKFMTVSAVTEAEATVVLPVTTYAEYDEKTRTITTAISEEFRTSVSGTNYPTIGSQSMPNQAESIEESSVVESLLLPIEPVVHERVDLQKSDIAAKVEQPVMTIEQPQSNLYILPRFGPPLADVAEVTPVAELPYASETVSNDVVPVVEIADIIEPSVVQIELVAANSGITLAEIEEEIGNPPEAISEPVAPLPVFEEHVVAEEDVLPSLSVSDAEDILPNMQVIEIDEPVGAEEETPVAIAEPEIAEAIPLASQVDDVIPFVAQVDTKDVSALAEVTESAASIPENPTVAYFDDTMPVVEDVPVTEPEVIPAEAFIQNDGELSDSVSDPAHDDIAAVSALAAEEMQPQDAQATMTVPPLTDEVAVHEVAASHQPEEQPVILPSTIDLASPAPEITPEVLAELSAMMMPSPSPNTQVLRPQDRTTYLERHRPTEVVAPTSTAETANTVPTPSEGVQGSWLSRTIEPQVHVTQPAHLPTNENGSTEQVPVPVQESAEATLNIPPTSTRTRTPTRPMPRLERNIIDPSTDV